MIYAVIDTNVLVSALITRNSQSATVKVVRCLLEGGFIPLYDNDIIEEYEDVLHRYKFNILPDVTESLISLIVEKGIEIHRTAFSDSMLDEDDRAFYEITLSVDDSFLVTGNLKHFPDSPKVVTPSEFIEILEGDKLNLQT